MRYEAFVHVKVVFGMEFDADDEQKAIQHIKDEFALSAISDCDLTSDPIVIIKEVGPTSTHHSVPHN